MQTLPGQCVGGETAKELLVIDEAALRAVSDPWERARLAADLHAQLQQRAAVVLDVRRDAVRELVNKVGVARNRVARFLGLTPARISQLVGSTTATPSPAAGDAPVAAVGGGAR